MILAEKKQKQQHKWNSKWLVFVLTALLLSSSVQAQVRYRFSLTYGPSVTTGNTFQGGYKEVSTPDLTGGHRIQSMFSLLWGYPNPQYSFWQNFARKFAIGGRVEGILTPRKSVSLGLEFGSRGYIINSDLTNNLLETWRNIAMPIIFTHNGRAGYFWTFRKHAGIALNYAQSFEKYEPGQIESHPSPQVYPALYVGVELANLNIRGPVCFELAYQHGFYNVIDHRYLALNYDNGIPISATGSAFKLMIKWNFGERTLWLKNKRKAKKIIIG